jgi:hypothetical protein
MPIVPRQLIICPVIALLACSLSACGTINEKLAAGVGDYVPQWAGGLPPDAPPRPGTAKYEEFMRERERKRLEPAVAEPVAAKNNAAKTTAATNAVTLDPVH